MATTAEGAAEMRSGKKGSARKALPHEASAAKAKPKYGRAAGERVEKALHEMKQGKLESGRSGKKVTDRKQAIAIGIAEARREGARAPEKPAAD